ncbi:hypothetical protein SDRG_06349 [Saprolegnia diclina VS20]|uniref:GOLD domain-containing protein n=1 Tax=Saprolegnia diclina (strain VS20) TaxID=1156394 RepID=T0S0L2_SAPDV|nr:hypothetical protein SDRG_06349 [Saprolegnia diclina VS20]EQC36242.1 hypothetical protein SDRG_06349 [Saprolegnia diclina VS20]|eukprot:XP_008610348.1 hypothetical protein SDRG_06349 [Saprolegnia diclina VS20]
MAARTACMVAWLFLAMSMVSSLMVVVPGRSKECFIEYVKTKRTAFLRIAVVESQELYDIRLTAYGPFAMPPTEEQTDMNFFNSLVTTTPPNENSNDVQHNGFNFDTEHRGGWYKFCLGNEHSSYEGKKVDFSTNFGLTKEDELGHEDEWEAATKQMHVETVKGSLEHLRELFDLIKYEQNYYLMRDKRHHKTAESNQSRIFWYTSIQVLLVAVVYGVQIRLLNQWFSGSGGLLSTTSSRQWA